MGELTKEEKKAARDKERVACRKQNERIKDVCDDLFTKLHHKSYWDKRTLKVDEELLYHALKQLRYREDFERAKWSYHEKDEERRTMKADLKEARRINQELRLMIEDASNRSGLFIKFVKEKLGI